MLHYVHLSSSLTRQVSAKWPLVQLERFSYDINTDFLSIITLARGEYGYCQLERTGQIVKEVSAPNLYAVKTEFGSWDKSHPMVKKN